MKQLTLSLLICSLLAMGNAWASDVESREQTKVNYPESYMLFDSRTGHKYIQNGENSYDEYSKRGKYLKTVRADLPLLVKSKHVYPTTEATYMLFDSRTGHRYIKKSKNSYSEFSKKGKYLKTVRADLPLLVKGRHIHPITERTFILYKKEGAGKNEYTVLPGTARHPNGCKSLKMLVAIE